MHETPRGPGLSPLQTIELVRDPVDGLTLFIDGATQFREIDEHRYHEGLAVLPALFTQSEVRTVFIGGGGDGLALRYLLRFPDVERVVLCDFDAAVTELARTDPDLVALNQDSLSDARVELVNADARAYLEGSREAFDLLLCDFPSPHSAVLGRLYSREYYELARARLRPGGVLVTQTCAPSPRCSALVQNTLAAVFRDSRAYRVRSAEGRTAGFTLACDEKLRRRRAVPEWTRHLTDEVVDAAFAFGKDELPSVPVSTDDNGLVARWWLLDELADELSECPYAPNHKIIQPDADHAPSALPDLMRAVAHDGPMLAYLPERLVPTLEPTLAELGYSHRRDYVVMSYAFTPPARDRLRELWHRLDNGSVPDIEAFHCRTKDNDELVELFKLYLERHSDNYLDVAPTRSPLDEERLHLVVRRPDGSAAVLMVVRPAGWIVDVLFGLGPARQSMLGLMLCLRFLDETYGPRAGRVVFSAATDNIVQLMLKLGAEQLSVTEVWAPAPEA